MKKNDYPTHYAKTKSGWTDWIIPNMSLYGLACCDCGLVHDVQFEIWEKGKALGNGNYELIKRLDSRKYRIRFRVCRNEEDTKALRKRERIRVRL